MKYFKRFWGECRGDQHSEWGNSWWYFEVDNSSEVHRQLEIYHNGTVIKYDHESPSDERGGLATEFDLTDMAPYEIEKQEFEEKWLISKIAQD